MSDDRAGATTPELEASYERCRRVHAAHGRTYYLATRFLPTARRRHVHAMYAFARCADEIVDGVAPQRTVGDRRRELSRWSDGFLRSLESGRSDDPVLRAVIHTVTVLDLRHEDLRAFLRSMAMDLSVTRYPTYAALRGYMHGSAAVIGSMMLPLLGPIHHDARARAMDLGVAFQLTNFLRDVAEDWDRGRIYLPLEDLQRFGVDEADFHARHVGPRFRRLLAFEIERTRGLYRRAEAGWDMLAPSSRRCVRIAHRLYGAILDRIERADYQVFRTRAVVPPRVKLAVTTRELLLPSRAGRDAGVP